MTPLQQNILSAIGQANALTASEIARDIGAHRDQVQAALHQMDDAGQVIIKNGFYRLAEAAKESVPMTPLQIAQEHHAAFSETHASIVDSLRKTGMSREDAVEFADGVEARALAEKEASARQA